MSQLESFFHFFFCLYLEDFFGGGEHVLQNCIIFMCLALGYSSYTRGVHNLPYGIMNCFKSDDFTKTKLPGKHIFLV